MPRPTRGNLDATRRDRVLDAAMREFGRHGYSGGSLNPIARDAGVAKGSLFQYFLDKSDPSWTRLSRPTDAVLAAVVVDEVGQPAPRPPVVGCHS